MIPSEFKEQNCVYNPPSDLDESQCGKIKAYKVIIDGGNLDGSPCVIVAWKPSEKEIENIKNGSLVYVGMIGGLVPHTVQTSIKDMGNIKEP